jgi:O-antigen/teichoic acid export membrane protein
MADDVRTGTFRRNVSWLLVGSAGQALLSGLVLLVMGRELEPSGFGVFSVVMGFVYVANLLLEPRIQDVAAKQFWDFDRDDATRIHHSRHFVDFFALEATGKLAPCLALVVLAPLLEKASNLPAGTHTLIVIAAVGTYFSKLGWGLSVGLLRVLGRSDLYTYCATGELLLRLLITVLLVRLSDLTVLGCIAAVCLAGMVSNALQWILTARHLKGIGAALLEWTPSGAFRRLRENRRLLLSNLGLSASDLMNRDLDVVLISPLLRADQVGMYKMAKNIALLTWRAIDPFYLALMPEANRLVSTGNFAGVNRLLARTSSGLFFLALGLSAASLALVVRFGDVVLGTAFSEVPKVMPLMLLGIVSCAPLVWGHPLSVALNRADFAVAGSFLGTVIGLIAFYFLTPRYGAYGAGIAWTLALMSHFVFTSGMSFRLLRKRARLFR